MISEVEKRDEIHTARERLELAIAKMAVILPLAYVPLAQLVKVEREEIKTMGVGPYNKIDIALYYSPTFVMSLNKYQLRAVLQHEALHILLQHITRGKVFGANLKLYNIAADLTINPRLPGIPEWGYFPKTVKLPDNESSEFYYSQLKQRRDEFKEKLKKQLSKGAGSGEGGGQNLDEDFLDSLEGSLLDDHSLWDEMSEEEKSLIAEKIRDIADKALDAQSRQGWGNLPGNLADQIIAANKPIVNWKRELRYFVNRLISFGRKTTRTRPNRRYGYKHPGMKRNYLSKILVAIDCSGSVSDKELNLFVNELNGMVGNVQVDVIPFDTICHGKPQKFTRKNATIKIHGRGGTCFSPVIEMADELKYDGLIIMTDGEAPFPDKPKCQVMWAICKRPYRTPEPPYGKIIIIEEN